MEFTVVAFNAHWGLGRYGDARGVRFDVAALIQSWDPDIAVVPESFRFRDGSGILDPLADAGYVVEQVQFMDLALRLDPSGIRDGAPRHGTWELAICSRFPLLERSPIVLRNVKSDPVPERTALSVTVEIDGRAVEVVGLHTSSRLHVFAPVRHLLSARPHLGRGMPQIIAGDFNFWGPPVAALMPGWQRPVRGATWPAHRPHSQIDHVLVRGGIEPIAGEVLGETPSDHRPVRARLRLV
jgi:endonuclease/exonuclease/phosphatase family metal-dependent hydrolase